MIRFIYKVSIDNKEIAIFYSLEDVMIFIEGICRKYHNELNAGLNFTIKKEVIENDKSI